MKHTVRTRMPLAIISLLLITSCDSSSGSQRPLVQHSRSGLTTLTSFDVYADGQTLHVLASGTLGQDPTERLHYQRSSDGGDTWSEPVRLETAQPPPYKPTANHTVQIAARGAHLVAVWETKGTGWGEYGPLALALSADDGQTWQPGPRLVNDGEAPEQSFYDLKADEAGGFHLVWLEDGKPEKEGDTYFSSALMAASSRDHGVDWGIKQLVDDETCTCCANTLITPATGSQYVIYRDAVPRDMRLASTVTHGDSWQQQSHVGQFAWDFTGCPHVGAGLIAVKNRLHATVWTGHQERLGVYYLVSEDGGRSWSAPQRFGSEQAHNSDIAALDANQLLAVWDTAQENDFAIVVSRSTDGGQTWQPPRVLHRSATLVSWPRAVATPSGFRVFWIEQKEHHEWATMEVQYR
jgi:hypothetical protein